jgi:nicotinate-nucleotide pyrophosphorylase (carboxylating)
VGLYDQILIKENHLAFCGDLPVREAVRRARKQAVVEIEVQTVSEAREAAQAGADIILLDNFSVEELPAAVAAVRECAPPEQVQLEVSGGVTLERVRLYASAGVERISIGALTHSAPALDLSLLLQPRTPKRTK